MRRRRVLESPRGRRTRLPRDSEQRPTAARTRKNHGLTFTFFPIVGLRCATIIDVVQQVEDLVGKRGRKEKITTKRRLPIGAEVVPGQGVHFRVWAPRSKSVSVELEGRVEELQPEGKGYFGGLLKDAGAGTLYKYKLDTGSFPDPASRFQPEGPHGRSPIV